MVVFENNYQSKSYGKREFDFSQPDKSARQYRLTPFPFDPNNLTEEGWIKMGLSPYQIKTIMNYRSKGGSYRCKTDFKKMYCISESDYNTLEEFILLPDKIEYSNKNYQYNNQKNEDPINIELNSTTEYKLVAIRGIGDYFAKQIIKYRDKLGGFYKVEQLMEVPNMDSVRYLKILPFISVNSQATRKMNVNETKFEVLSKHPYIGYNVALSLINYRQHHGDYQTLEDIKKSALVTDVLYEKISHYLKV